ncbi:MAG: hypothetical protein KJ747_00410 [Actinobacteria bacterium]|nr:hypothetical protein [Actinomycetota bacterium]MCG2808702.1 hypothetical protein [Coriobacteriia bacterium]
MKEGAADDEVQEILGRVLALVGDCEHFVVLMGTPGAGSKATLALRQNHGNSIAFAKIAWTRTARSLVRHEASMLPVVGGDFAPHLLGHIESESLSCIVLAPLTGSAVGLTASIPRELLSRAALNVAASAPIGEHPFFRALMVADCELASRAAGSLAGREFSVLPTHGDAAPWNSVCGAGGVIRMFDWEYGRREGLPLTDVAHWSLQVSHLSLHLVPLVALRRAALELKRETGLSALEVAGILALTALEVALRLESESDLEQARWWRECAEHAAACAEGEGI